MDITQLEMNDGDPGYFTKGHVDMDAFAKQIAKDFEEEISEFGIAHVYLKRGQPPEGQDSRWFKGYWWKCDKDAKGAFPATMATP